MKQPPIKIKDKLIANGQDVFIIAEMACAHEGDVGLVRHLIDAAAESGADAVQFQIFSVKDYIAPHHESIDLLKRLEITPNSWQDLFAYAQNKKKLAIFAAAYDRPSADLADSCGVDAYKLHSADLSNPYLTQYIAAKGKPVTLGTGASTIGEIAAGVEFLQDTGCNQIILMHGYQNFPTKIEQAHLNYMLSLKQLFALPIGYQDHSAGDSVWGYILPLAAMGLGVQVIEKHYTHNRAAKGVDHQSALNPDELEDFVSKVRKMQAALGQPTPHKLSEDEQKYRRICKKSIVAAKDIPAGEILTDKHFLYMRSSPGIPPIDAPKLLGHKVKNMIKQYENITFDKVY